MNLWMYGLSGKAGKLDFYLEYVCFIFVQNKKYLINHIYVYFHLFTNHKLLKWNWNNQFFLQKLCPLWDNHLFPFLHAVKPIRLYPKDVEDIKFVINYDYPNSSEDYVHRIGRTARSTNKGTAYTFFTPGNLRQARDLVRVLAEARQAINPKLLQFVDAGQGGGRGGKDHHCFST